MKRLYLVILLISLLGLTACQDAERTISAADVAENDRYGGTLTFAISVPIVGDLLDPHRSASPGNSRIQRSMFDSLVAQEEDGSFAPWLATEWEISEDQKSYTFHLRDDVTFTDGTPFNAEAVKFNFERIKNLDAPGLSLSFIGPYESTEIIDEHTVRIHFSKPFSPFLSNLATENLAMVSPTAVEERGDSFAVNPVGSGPFKVTDYTLGTEYVLERNEDYNWGPANAGHTGKAYLDKLVIKIITEDSTRVSSLHSGDVDAIDTIPPQHVEVLENDKDLNISEVELLNYNAAIQFNATEGLLQDKELREALRVGVDWDAIVRTVYLGTYDRAYAALSPSLLGADTDLEGDWEFNAGESEAMLDELGWKKGEDGIRVKDGKRLSLEMIDFYANREKRMDVMTMVQNSWKNIGVELNIHTISRGEYTDRRMAGDYDMWIGSQYGPDPDGVLRAYLVAKEGYHDEYEDTRVTELLDAATDEQDTEKRAALYQQLQEYLFEEVYSIPVYVLPYTVAASKQVYDIDFDTKGSPYFYDTWVLPE
ncbi:ABC transporter substrate-binding protein [Terribacillus saccharophilus]|uniref:ABC transporter substrate-binding protein n=1 Tax=Terribacillus saccharophilus TaxID=361277 RepID=UPI002DC7C842|nr:ABC transporter substrate-binding protein [Terribacillus saccharophilus]